MFSLFKKKVKVEKEPVFEKQKNVLKNFTLDGLQTNLVVGQELIDVIDLDGIFSTENGIPIYRYFAECSCGSSWWCTKHNSHGRIDYDSLRFHYLNCDKAKTNDNQ